MPDVARLAAAFHRSRIWRLHLERSYRRPPLRYQPARSWGRADVCGFARAYNRRLCRKHPRQPWGCKLPLFLIREPTRSWRGRRTKGARGSVSRVLSTPSSLRTEGIGDHSSRTTLARRLQQPTRATDRNQIHMPPLFGLAPGGVCRAAPVARRAVRSCRTLSPLPRRNAAVCSLWHCPWSRLRRALPGTVVPWSPDFPRAPESTRGRPTLWLACPSRHPAAWEAAMRAGSCGTRRRSRRRAVRGGSAAGRP